MEAEARVFYASGESLRSNEHVRGAATSVTWVVLLVCDIRGERRQVAQERKKGLEPFRDPPRCKVCCPSRLETATVAVERNDYIVFS